MRHMKTIALKTTLLAVSGLGLLATSSTQAMAWGCGNGAPAAYCNTGTSVNAGQAPAFGPMTVNVSQPMGYLRTVDYQRAPNVSITRVHGMMDTAALSDFPSNFTQGCHPTSTTYCRQDMGTPVNVEFNSPQVPSANFNASNLSVGNFNFAQPARMAPVMSAPQFTGSRIVAIGGGYDPSKFAPRVYGNNTFTPGIAHVPTSYVDRSPINAANALAGAGYGASGYSTGGYSAGSYNLGGTAIMASGNALAGGPTYAQNLSLSPVASNPFPAGSPVGNDNPTSPVDATGGYWEKVSGLTMFGSTVATSVVCRRQAPRPEQRLAPRVVRPVVGVPVPVPTPVPYYVDVPIKIHGQGIPNGCRRVSPVPPTPMGPMIGSAMPIRPAMAMRPMMRPAMRPAPMMRQGFGPRFGGGFALQMRPQMHPSMNTGWTF